MDNFFMHSLKEIFEKNGKKMAVAESLTCGLIQSAIGDISGASNFFIGGITTYSIESKVKLLGINKLHAESVNAVSQLVAYQMAEGVCKLFNSDIGISTTGYAEPDTHREIKFPIAYIGICINYGLSLQNTTIKMVEGRELTRNSMREYVKSKAITELIQLLK